MSSLSDSIATSPRTYHSLLIDALTVGVFFLGLALLHDTFDLVDLSQPLGRILKQVRPSLPLGAVFCVLFFFLIHDWQAARRIDALTPFNPCPHGARFYLDVCIAVLFVAAFYLAQFADSRLLAVMTLIYGFAVLWAVVIFRYSENAEARSLGLRYITTHSFSAGVFFGLYQEARSSPASQHVLQRGDLITFLLAYAIVELFDFSLRSRRIRALGRPILLFTLRGLFEAARWVSGATSWISAKLAKLIHGIDSRR